MALIQSSFKRINQAPCNDGSIPLTSFELPDAREYDIFICKDVTQQYTIDQDDSNKYLIFDDAGNGILHIPDNMYRGTALIFTNIGVGAVEVVMDGLETVRGSLTIADVNGFMTLVKITDTIWQCSER
jgi:hypothetical protein